MDIAELKEKHQDVFGQFNLFEKKFNRLNESFMFVLVFLVTGVLGVSFLAYVFVSFYDLFLFMYRDGTLLSLVTSASKLAGISIMIGALIALMNNLDKEVEKEKEKFISLLNEDFLNDLYMVGSEFITSKSFDDKFVFLIEKLEDRDIVDAGGLIEAFSGVIAQARESRRDTSVSNKISKYAAKRDGVSDLSNVEVKAIQELEMGSIRKGRI